MLRKVFLTGLALVSAAVALSAPVLAQRSDRLDRIERREERREMRQEARRDARRYVRGDWELLGVQKVGFLADRDVFRVGRQDGRFRAIRLKVRKNDIHLIDLKVVYGNGTVEDLRVRRNIRAGGETRAIDLAGHKRFIREVILTYKSRPSFKGQALVEVWGLH